MEAHSSGIFIYDKEATRVGYGQLDYKFSNATIENACLEKLVNAMNRNAVDLGIDFKKPWEEVELDENHYQIEYLFVGKTQVNNGSIADEKIGINIYEEIRFGQEIFKTNDLLNLTLVIEK